MSLDVTVITGPAGNLKVFLPMRLQAEGSPDSRHGHLRKAHLPGHCTYTPVRRALGYGLQRLRDSGIDTCVVDRCWRTRTRRVEQAIEPKLHLAPTPLRDSLLSDPKFRRDRLVVGALGAGQHNPRSQCQRLRNLSPHRQGRELIALRFAQHKFRLRSPTHHRLVVFAHSPKTTSGNNLFNVFLTHDTRYKARPRFE